MKYKAVIFFKDLHDSNHAYNPGDEYPREGLQVSDKRLEELSTNKNRRGTPVIAAIPEKKAPKAKSDAEALTMEREADQAPEPPTEPAEVEKPKRTRKKNAD
jgi:hypothetical protein